MICFPSEIDVPQQSDDSNDQRSQQERSVVEVDQLTSRPNLKAGIIVNGKPKIKI